jgi:hypothetical protein
MAPLGKDHNMDIAKKLSWEIVSLNDRGDGTPVQYLALEVAYGVALQVGDQPDAFSSIMSSVIEQVTDAETKRNLRISVARGLK